MSIEKIKGKDGSLFTIKGKKYIYVGLQTDKTGKKKHTFYGLDGLNGLDKVDLNGISLNDLINESTTNPNESVKKIVKSSIYNEYKVGIPDKLRTMPGLSGAAAFYEIPGPNATPKRLTIISEKEKMLDPSNPNYTYRIGTNGPSLQYISEGKIKNISKFIDDYKKMILKKSVPRANSPVLPAVSTDSNIAKTADKAKESLKNLFPLSTQQVPSPKLTENLKDNMDKAKESLKNLFPLSTQQVPSPKLKENLKDNMDKAKESLKNLLSKPSSTQQVPSPESPKPTGGKSRNKKYKKNKSRKFKK